MNLFETVRAFLEPSFFDFLSLLVLFFAAMPISFVRIDPKRRSLGYRQIEGQSRGC